MSRHPIFANTTINIIHTAISFVIAYAMTPIILQRVGGEAYGIWVFLGIFSISGYFSLLDFGFQGAAIKYVAEYVQRNDQERLQHLVSSILFFFLAVGIIGAIGIFAFNSLFLVDVFHLPAEQISLIKMLVNLIALSFIFQFPALGFTALIEGVQRYGYLRGVSIVVALISNAILLFSLTAQNGITLLVIVMISGSLLMTILYALVAKKLLPGIRFLRFHFDRAVFTTLFSLSGKLFASKIVGLIFNNTDKILIGIFLTVFDQTEYDIVNKMHIILLTILSMMNSAVLPASSAFNASKDQKSLQTLLLRGTKYSAAFLLPTFGILMVFPEQLLNAWVGTAYGHLAPLVRLYSSHMLLTMLVGISSTMLVGINKVQVGLRISIWAAVLNLFVSIFTVKLLGITGLILGTVVAYAISSTLYIIYTNKIFAVPHGDFFRKTVVPLLLPSVLLGVFLFIVSRLMPDPRLIGLAVITLCGYLIFLIVFFLVSLETRERQSLIELVRRRKPTETPTNV